MSNTSSGYERSVIVFVITVVTALILIFVFFNYNDPLTTGTFITGTNCSILTCPAGPIGPIGVGIIGPPGTKGVKGDQG